MKVTNMIGSPAKSAPKQQGPSVSAIMTPAMRGAPKFRKQMPPTMAAAERQASVAATQSPLIRLRKVPAPTPAAQATPSRR